MSAQPAPSYMTDLQQRATIPEHVVHRTFAEETVVLNLRTGTYHGLNGSGARMFEILGTAPSLQAAASQLAEEYEQPLEAIREDLIEFVAQLVELDLVVVDAGV